MIPVPALRALAAGSLLATLLTSCATVRLKPEHEPAPPESRAAALESVQARLEAGDAAGAIAEFERVFGEQPPASDDAALYASLLREAARPQRSRRVLEEVLAREPRNTDALYALALLERGDHAEAKERELLERILAIDAEHADAAAAIGDARRLEGDREAARMLFERALRRDPAHPLALLGVGRLAFDAGDFRDAERAFTAAAEAHPELSTAWFERYRARRRLGDDQGALADLDRGLQLEPEFTWGLIDRGRLLLFLGRSEDALADFERAASLDSSNFVAFAHVAAIHYQTRRWAAARLAFATVVKLNPDYTAAYPTLGELAWRLGDYSEAAQWFGRAHERRPQEPAYALLAALSLKRQGEQTRAAATLRELLPGIAKESWCYVTAEFLIRPDWDLPLFERLRSEKNEIVKKRMLFYVGVQYLDMGRRPAGMTYLLEAASLELDDLPEKQLAEWEVEHGG